MLSGVTVMVECSKQVEQMASTVATKTETSNMLLSNNGKYYHFSYMLLLAAILDDCRLRGGGECAVPTDGGNYEVCINKPRSWRP